MDVVLAEADHLDTGLRQARVDRPDRREQRHGVAALAQGKGGLDRDFGLSAVDVGVVEDEDDVQGARPSASGHPIPLGLSPRKRVRSRHRGAVNSSSLTGNRRMIAT